MKRKTIIISDLHLASPDAEYEKLLKFLKINTGEKIILN
jgi:UDP-2,3-diacylglucosamine pyrophosphatase LpxH